MRFLAAFLITAPVWGCGTCHTDQASAFESDVHKRHGLTCAGCHGGDVHSEDMSMAMSRAKGFTGKPARTAVPALCARCHSNAAFMHQYDPKQRVDQLAQYQTSVHGKRLAAGDTKVANCADCHGAHGIRAVRDPLSSVHPLRVAQTCAGCHANAARMAGYKLPTDQFAKYRASVHWEAVEKRGDFSAPTCASCHGNHGATPPEVRTVAAVCGTCHVLFEQRFASSVHGKALEGCHTCHGNHEVRKPSRALFASLCTGCHTADSPGGKTAVQMSAMLGNLEAELARSDRILNQARASGMEVSEAQMQLLEGRENLVKARVEVHAFQLAAMAKPVNDGLAVARQTYSAGQAALKERDGRRVGLALSLIAILATMLGLWMTIRNLERKPEAGDTPAGR
ncbi:MAG: hypothetical protein ACE15B_04735 [Bryobacteraceae bacterium]